jgi:hypothetical protein
MRLQIFLLEDNETRIEWFLKNFHFADITVCKDMAEVDRMWNPPYDCIFLDHDLGGEIMVNSKEQNTGAGFVRYVNICGGFDCPVIVHSHNEVGAEYMKREIGANATRLAFGELTKVWDAGYFAVCGHYKHNF